ncbi:MAG: ATP-binding protein [Ruminococcus sp.]|nr:ATP-binding protein [Ruminococcus sp.]
MKELDLLAVKENLDTVTGFVDSELEQLGCSVKVRTQISIAVEEIFVNIASYAYDPETGPATVRTEIVNDPLSVVISFIDNGMPYDPLARPDPDVTLPLRERSIGGLGIFMVKQTMDDVVYNYKDGQNILTIRKQLE